MADYELIGLNEATPDLRAPTSADRGILQGGLQMDGLAELDGGADINGDPVATVSRTNPLARAVAVQMSASTTVPSIRQLSSAATEITTGDFELEWEGVIDAGSDATQVHRLVGKYQNIDNRLQFTYQPSTKTMSFFARKAAVNIISGAAGEFVYTAGITLGKSYKLRCVVRRETATAGGSVKYYVNGILVGTTTIPAAATVDISNTGSWFYHGNNIAGLYTVAGDFNAGRVYNYAHDDAAILRDTINGPALADRGASQTEIFSNSTFDSNITGWAAKDSATLSWDAAGRAEINITGSGGGIIDAQTLSLSVGKKYLITADTIAGTYSGNLALVVDNTVVQSLAASASTRFTFVYTATVVNPEIAIARNSAATGTFFVDNFSLKQTGLTSELLASNAQSDTGQILQSAGNGAPHGLLPASGATIVNRPVSQSREVRSTHAWSATSELQYLSGVNQAILPATAAQQYIDVITDAVVTLNIGDGSDPDRYVSGAVLSIGRNRLALASPFCDGTNRKMTVTPSASFTGTLDITAVYHVLED